MKIVKTVQENNEIGARRQLVEELFYDLNRNKARVYWMNFVRGIFFGFGTLLGGTVLVAILVWILGQFAGWFPSIGSYIHQIIDAVQHVKY
jgi:hypothetical protein